ncbi:MAG: NAD(P)H-dependent oxidoreductase subunit E, partial [Bacteroidota bacterium]
MFSEDNLNKIEKLKSQYPTTKAITLPVLWLAQEQFGWISHETMMYIAELLDVPVSEIYGVVTFYTMYNQEPRGKYHLQVCTNVSCSLRGSEQIVRTICESQKIKMGETSADKRFTITEV